MSAITNFEILSEMQQGSKEWLSLRTTKITSTDAAVILGASHWKNKLQLYHEKISDTQITHINARMQRGLELEDVARELFSIQHGIYMYPRVVVKDWAMASLDGMSDCGKYILEIKCPGEKDHQTALQGKVPEHYYPQLQHQLYVTGLDSIFYYSFDGVEGTCIVVKRDDDYIEKMVEEEKKFYDCLINKTPPQQDENDYIQRDDILWDSVVSNWKDVCDKKKHIEKEEEDLRNQLIFLSGGYNVRGSGISLCKINRKGSVDYSKIPELKNVDLDKYRKASTESWRITVNAM